MRKEVRASFFLPDVMCPVSFGVFSKHKVEKEKVLGGACSLPQAEKKTNISKKICGKGGGGKKTH